MKYYENMGTNYVKDKVVCITGAGSGFGRLTAIEVVKMGGKVVVTDIIEERILETVQMLDEICEGACVGFVANAAVREDVAKMVDTAVESYGHLDCIIANAGTMPLAPWSEHKKAMQAWETCIDVNLKGTMYAISESYDTFMQQGRGQVIVISSVYGNAPVYGGTVYQATKIGVRFLADTLRQETQGKIKTTIICPSGVNTNLASTVVDPAGAIGIFGRGYEENQRIAAEIRNGMADPDYTDLNSPKMFKLPADQLVWAIMFALNQPWGVSMSYLEARATGEMYIL